MFFPSFFLVGTLSLPRVGAVALHQAVPLGKTSGVWLRPTTVLPASGSSLDTLLVNFDAFSKTKTRMVVLAAADQYPSSSPLPAHLSSSSFWALLGLSPLGAPQILPCLRGKSLPDGTRC